MPPYNPRRYGAMRPDPLPGSPTPSSQKEYAVSLMQERHATHRGDAGPSSGGGREVRGTRTRWAGALLVCLGLLLMVPAVAEALASNIYSSEEGEVLRGSVRDERIRGLGGEDELYGGEGTDELFSGDGDDFVEASDGERDFVSCGPGADTASVDFIDLVAGDCERIYPG